MISQHRWSSPAPHGKRLIAFLIDMTITQVLAQAVIYLLKITPEMVQSITGLVTILYFVLLQSQFGWTPGKKVLGLELVEKDSEQVPNFFSILGRETIGRGITLASFGLGYILIFLNADHQGLHDKIFKTQVVTQESQDEGVSIIQWILGAVGTLTALVLGFAYVMLFTAFPLKEMAKNLEVHGVQIDGIEGNLMRGFSVARLSHSSPESEMLAEGLVFKYKNLWEIYRSQSIHVHEVSVSKMSIKILNAEGNKNQQTTDTTNSIKETENKESGKPGSQVKSEIEMIVDRIDINNLEVSYLDKNNFRMDRFLVSKMKFSNKQEAPRFEISQVWFESPEILVNLGQMFFTKEFVEVSSSQVLVKKALKPDLLASDIDLQFQLKINFPEKKYEGSVQAFRKSLRAAYINNQVELTTKNLNPHWFIKNVPPIHSMNLELKADLLSLMLAPPVKGTYMIRNRQFTVAPAQPGQLLAADFLSDGRKISSRLVFHGYQPGSRPLDVVIESSHHSDLNDALSELYYSKKPIQLAPHEMTAVLGDQKHFQYQRALVPNQMTFPNSNRVPAQFQRFQYRGNIGNQ